MKKVAKKSVKAATKEEIGGKDNTAPTRWFYNAATCFTELNQLIKQSCKWKQNIRAYHYSIIMFMVTLICKTSHQNTHKAKKRTSLAVLLLLFFSITHWAACAWLNWSLPQSVAFAHVNVHRLQVPTSRPSRRQNKTKRGDAPHTLGEESGRTRMHPPDVGWLRFLRLTRNLKQSQWMPTPLALSCAAAYRVFRAWKPHESFFCFPTWAQR